MKNRLIGLGGADASIFDVGVLRPGVEGTAAENVSATPAVNAVTLSVNDTADHVINASELTDVAFTVSRLDAGETGTVTFTDAANHQVMVNIDVNGSYAADLSALTDGTITSSLSAASPSGITTSATGNTVTLDTDRDLTPIVSVNALDPAHVTFTISGLEGDESGTMTFTDVNGKQVVVDVGSNGNYLANLSSLAQGQVTYLVSEKDAAGNIISFDPPFGLGDGSATAAAGTPQVPNLLNGYAVRPPWQVAGVDYAVGINAGTALGNPLTINMAGVSLDTTNKIVYVTGNNVVLNGWNFTGWSVSITGANATVTNSDFTHGVLRFEPAAVGGTAMYNHFDQSGVNGGFSDVPSLVVFGAGSYVIEYNDFENASQMHAQFTYGNNGGDMQVTFQYNLLENSGLSTPQGGHGDFIQVFGGMHLTNGQFNYNTVVQNNQTAASQGFSIHTDNDLGMGTISVSNNTVVTKTNVNYIVLLDQQWISGTATVSNNYVDMSGVVPGGDFTFITNASTWAGPLHGTIVESNDVNMVNGTFFDGSGTGTISSTAITSISTDSNIVGDLITNDNTLTLSGTAPANSTVKVFDGSTQIGTTTANASGAWSYNTATLADGNHGFTISATSSGTTTTSTVRTVTVDTSAPGAPTITSFSPDTGTLGDGLTTANTLTLTGSAGANSTVKVFDGTTQIGTANANASGAWSLTTGTLSNATHAFTAKAMDAAGNTGGASTALNVTVNAPPNLVTNGSFETGSFSGWTVGGNSGVVSAGPQTAVDGNAESGQFAANIGAIGSDATLSQAIQTTAGQHYTLTFWLANGFAGPNDFTVKWNGTTLLSLANAPAQGYKQYTFDVVGTAGTSQLLISGRQDPSHWSLDAISVMPTGVQSPPAGPDTTPPTAPTIASFTTDSGTVGDRITNDNTLVLSGTAEANSTVKLFDGSNQIGSTTANASGAWTYTTAALTNGAHSLTATASDAAGNTGVASSALSVTIDTTAPNVPAIVSDAIVNANEVLLTGTAEANSKVTVFDGGALLGTATADAGGAWHYTTSPLSDGPHAFTAMASDAAGNTSPATQIYDPIVGGTTIEANGAISLIQVGNHYYLDDNTGAVPPSFKYGGANYVAGQYGAWTPVAAEKTATGYEVAWKFGNADLYTVWTTDNNGNYVSNTPAVSGTSATLKSLETSFHQDLNGDGQIGVVTTVVESNGSTHLTEVGNQYYLYDNLGAGPSLQYGGADYVAGQYGAWTPFAAEKTATGYEIAWKFGNADLYTVWTTDNNGNYVSNTPAVSGTSATLESLETSFNQDLNHDGQIGIPKTVVESNGATSLTEMANHFYLNDSTGSGPSLQYGGAGYVAGQYGAWTPFAAEKTATGYEVAWKFGNADLYTVWTTDNNGNYVSNTPAVSGTSATLESTEPSFNQDLNHDGYIGVVLNGASGAQTLNATGGTTTLIGGPNDVLNGGAGADTFVFPANFGANTVNNLTPGTDALQFSQSMFATVAAVLNDAQQVGSNVVITHDPQNVVTLHNTQLSNLHASDIHIV